MNGYRVSHPSEATMATLFKSAFEQRAPGMEQAGDDLEAIFDDLISSVTVSRDELVEIIERPAATVQETLERLRSQRRLLRDDELPDLPHAA